MSILSKFNIQAAKTIWERCSLWRIVSDTMNNGGRKTCSTAYWNETK